MTPLRQHIIEQVEQKERGRLFTISDLQFDSNRRSRVVAVLAELVRKGEIVREARGIYFRPKHSLLGLSYRPVDYEETLDFLCKKLNGYISGSYAFNEMQLTEQVAQVVTIACPKPVRRFETMNVRVRCIKACVTDLDGANRHHLRILDAIKSIRKVPGASPEKVYERLIRFHFKQLAPGELEEIVRLSQSYPPRVQKILAAICKDLQENLF